MEVLFKSEQLRFLRVSNGLTRKKLSELTGISISILSRYENKRVIPNLQIVDRIAKHFGVEVGDLIGLKEPLFINNSVDESLIYVINKRLPDVYLNDDEYEFLKKTIYSAIDNSVNYIKQNPNSL